MKLFKEILTITAIIIVIGAIYFLTHNFDINNLSIEMIMVMLLVIIIITVYLISIFKGRRTRKELKYREKLFDSLVMNDDTIYIMYDVKSKNYTYMTDNVCSILGKKEDISKEKENKESIRLIKGVFSLPIINEELRNWNKKSEFVSQMFSYRNSSYQYVRWLKIKIYPIIEKKSEYYIILISDVTKDHDKQHLLVTQAGNIKLREHQLNQITASSYDVEMDVNLTTNEAKINNLNDDLKYFGQNKEGKYTDILNTLVNKCVKEENRKEVQEILSLNNLKKISDEEKYEPISVKYQYNTEDVLWLESTAFFTKNNNDNIVTILTKDVTENAEYMRKQNILLQKALNDAKRANQAKSNFLATMSHDIRTPMNVITNLSASVLNEELSPNVREDIENINTASINLIDVIDGILDISKVENGIIELKEKNYELDKIFKDILNYTKESINKKQIKSSLSIEKTLPNNLYGDSSKLRQMITNIIDNIIDNTESGSIEISVKGSNIINNLKLNIELKCNGYNSITPFDTDENTDIVKKLIKLFNGELTIDNTPNGIVFNIYLNQKIIIEKSNNSSYIDLTDKKILIVDDDKLNLKVAARLLKQYNPTLTLVESGVDCINLIKANQKYDLILLDQMMPELDGISTLHELKNIEGFNIPTIMLTADAIKGKKEEYLKEGFNDYISKPIEKEELIKILIKYLKK